MSLQNTTAPAATQAADLMVLGMVESMLNDERENDLPGETRRALVAAGYTAREAKAIIREAKAGMRSRSGFTAAEARHIAAVGVTRG